MGLIDFHTHYFSRTYFQTLAAQSPLPGTADEKLGALARKTGIELPPEDPAAHLARWLAEMHKYGLEHLVSFASLPEELPVVAEAALRSQGRISGCALLNPRAPGCAEKAEAALAGGGHKGVLLFPALHGYAVSDLSVVYPVARGSGPLLSALLAVLLLGEAWSGLGLLGVAGICGGIWLIAGGPSLWQKVRSGAAEDAAARARVRAGLAWGAATGALIAAYTVIDGYSVKVVLISPILVDYFGNLLRIPFMLPACWRDRSGWAPAWRSQWRHALVMAVLSPLAYVLVLYAAQMAPLSHVAPAREVSMLFAALIGGRLLGEADRGWRLLGALCMAAGVVALALG